MSKDFFDFERQINTTVKRTFAAVFILIAAYVIGIIAIVGILVGLAVKVMAAEPVPAEPNWQHEIIEPTVQLDRDCSGTFVMSERDKTGAVQTLILTARHCVPKQAIGDAVEVYYPIYDASSRRIKEELLYGTVRGKHSIYDLALIQLVDKDDLYPVARLDLMQRDVSRWAKVYASGYPMGLTQTVTEGRLNQRITIPTAPYTKEVFLTTVPIAGGSSGGGLYAQIGDHYLLVGVASMATRDFPYALFVPVDHIMEYLKPFLTANAPRLETPVYNTGPR